MRLARALLIAIAVAIASFAVLVPRASAAPALPSPTALVPHAPIDIESNAAFTAANGVASGQGTASDPYVISGWFISAVGSIGIQLRNTDAHAVLRDLEVTDAAVAALYFYNAANVTLENVTADINSGDGIRFESSRAIEVTGCTLTGNAFGIVLLNSADALVRSTNFTANAGDGAVITGSPNVTFRDNAFSYNGFGGASHGIDLAFTTDDVFVGNRFTANGIYLDGDSLPFFDSHTITPDNLVGGLPILYNKDCNGLGLAGMELGQILLAGCHHVRLSNLTVAGADVAIEIAYGSDIVVGPGVAVSDAAAGVEITQSTGVQINASSILDTALGVEVDASTDVRIADSKIASPFAATGPLDGIVVRGSDLVNLSGNLIRYHRNAVAVTESGNVTVVDNVIGFSVLGLNVSASHDFEVIGNLFAQDTAGMRLVNLTRGNFSGNALWGILTTGANVSGSSGLRFTHNGFGGVRNNAYDAQGAVDAWDAGYPEGGNFWANYHGSDQYHGASQNIPGADGIGDTPYAFDLGAVDRYPLMSSPVTADVPPSAIVVVAPAAGTVLTPFLATANLSSDFEDALARLQVRWSWDNGGNWTNWTTRKYAFHVFGTPGMHSILLEVMDTAGRTDRWLAQVLVLPKPDGIPPTITIVAPANAEVGRAIPIVANITDPSGIANATLLYRGVDGGPFRPLPMQIENNGTNFTVGIPAQPHGGQVQLVIVANDTWANEARAPLSGALSIAVDDPVVRLLWTVVVPTAIVAATAAAVLFLLRRRKRARTPPSPQDERPPPSP